jgi:hypothetical protein
MKMGHLLRVAAALPAVLMLTGACGRALQKPAQQRVAPSSLAVAARGNPVRGAYLRTHGQTVPGVAAPYAAEYAHENGIDLDFLAKALFPSGYPQPPAVAASVLISSYHYKTGDWTYFKGPAVLIYELLKIESAGTREPMLLALYSRSLPEGIIIDQFAAEWRLALLSTSCQVLADVPFTTRIRHPEKGVWDMIYTDLAIDKAAPVVRIMYAHTGGGGGRDQEYTFRFAVEGPPDRLKLIQAVQTLDEYSAGGKGSVRTLVLFLQSR